MVNKWLNATKRGLNTHLVTKGLIASLHNYKNDKSIVYWCIMLFERTSLRNHDNIPVTQLLRHYIVAINFIKLLMAQSSKNSKPYPH